MVLSLLGSQDMVKQKCKRCWKKSQYILCLSCCAVPPIEACNNKATVELGIESLNIIASVLKQIFPSHLI
jgi:hypothetical protein